ncbi:MAG: rRNA maturation RNase YbeY [Deltaproteobacteria bacterium]|nr:rRNA maturation RNase YbeY [Deltaproteobacteria bacterium]
MKIWINNRQRKISISLTVIKKKIAKILNALGFPEAELSLTLINDRAMARLNRATFRRPGPTNVIAFPLRGGPFAHIQPQLLGDVVISLETTQRQAQQYGWSFDELLDLYLIHGILHLLGYDHETTEAEAARMADKTRELLTLIHPQLQEEPLWPT